MNWRAFICWALWHRDRISVRTLDDGSYDDVQWCERCGVVLNRSSDSFRADHVEFFDGRRWLSPDQFHPHSLTNEESRPGRGGSQEGEARGNGRHHL